MVAVVHNHDVFSPCVRRRTEKCQESREEESTRRARESNNLSSHFFTPAQSQIASEPKRAVQLQQNYLFRGLGGSYQTPKSGLVLSAKATSKMR
jgi:hypothetical protein